MNDTWYSLSWPHLLIVLAIIATAGTGWLVWEYLHAPVYDEE